MTFDVKEYEQLKEKLRLIRADKDAVKKYEETNKQERRKFDIEAEKLYAGFVGRKMTNAEIKLVARKLSGVVRKNTPQ